jgi:hypothetical protein
MSETKSFRLYHFGLAGGFGGLVAGGMIAFVLLVSQHIDVLKKVGGGNPPSPIKVRGGAMTVRTGHQNGWQKIKGFETFCSDNADPTYMTFTDATLTSGTPPDLTKIPYNWTLVIVGRNYPGDSASSNGIVLTSQSQSCDGKDNTVKSIKLSLQNDALFYSNDQPANEGLVKNKNPFAKRFQDTSYECTGPNIYNDDGDEISYDEDACERIYQFTLTTNPGTQQSSSSVYHCPNGECAIKIGNAD